MINYTASTVQALFDFLQKIGGKNGVDQSKVSSILPFANDPQSNSQSARQAAEVSELVVATAMFGPEIGIIYFNNIFDKLTVLIAQVLASADTNVNLQIISSIQSNFPYSFEQYADKSTIDKDNILNLLSLIATSYIATLKNYLSHISSSAQVVTSHLVTLGANLTTDSQINITVTKAILSAITSNIQSSLNTLFAPIRTVISDFNFSVSQETAINDLVGCFSELYQGIYSLNTTQILKNAQRLDSISKEIQNLTGIGFDSDMIASAVTLREKVEDLAWYATQVKPAEAVRIAIGDGSDYLRHHYHREDRYPHGYYLFLCLSTFIIALTLISAAFSKPTPSSQAATPVTVVESVLPHPSAPPSSPTSSPVPQAGQSFTKAPQQPVPQQQPASPRLPVTLQNTSNSSIMQRRGSTVSVSQVTPKKPGQ